jgi:hypothetical protein
MSPPLSPKQNRVAAALSLLSFTRLLLLLDCVSMPVGQVVYVRGATPIRYLYSLAINSCAFTCMRWRASICSNFTSRSDGQLKQRLKRVEEKFVIKAESLLSDELEHHAELRDVAGNH